MFVVVLRIFCLAFVVTRFCVCLLSNLVVCITVFVSCDCFVVILFVFWLGYCVVVAQFACVKCLSIGWVLE